VPSTPQPPPEYTLFNEDMERAVVGSILINEDALDEVASFLKPDDFYLAKYGEVYETMLRMRGEQVPIDYTTLLVEMNGKGEGLAGWLASLINAVPSSVHITTYAEHVLRYSWLRKTQRFAGEVVKRLTTGAKPMEVYEWATSEMLALTPYSKHRNVMLGEDTFPFYDRVLAERMAQSAAGKVLGYLWPENWYHWTELIPALRGGMIGLIGAGTKVGKSAYLECIAERWARLGHQVVMVHLEDALDYKLDRRTARHSSVPIEVLEGGVLDQEQQQRVLSANAMMNFWGKNLHYLPAPGWTMSQIVHELQEMAQAGQCDAVVLDYMDKVMASPLQSKLFGSNIWERQAHDMEQLKSFAEKANVPVMTATQGRKGFDGAVDLDSLQGTGQKAHKAQLVVLLHRPKVKDAAEAQRVGGKVGGMSPIVRVVVAAQNRGESGEFQQRFDGKTFSVYDVAKGE